MKCRLCGSNHLHLKFSVARFNPALDVYECDNCGFQQLIAEESQAYRFYDEAYYKNQKAYSYLDERENEPASRIVWNARLKRLEKWDHSTAKKRFLDVGCSFGGLMQTAQSFGYDPFGVEVSPYSGNYASKRFGQNKIFLGNIEEMSLPKNFFSAVTMIEVIEHLYNPRKALENLYQAMKPGGVILIQTADMSGNQALKGGADYHYYLPGHLSYFNRFNLKNLLLESGFSKVRFIPGVEFGLLPKLRKMRAGFQKPSDYLRWIKTSAYHFKSKIIIGKIHLTSSMVMAAWK